MADIDCREARGLVQASMDDELDAANTARFEAHLANCPDCSADRTRLMDLRIAIREDATRYQAPDALRRRLTESLMPKADRWARFGLFPAVRPARRWPGIAGGFAAGAALAAGLAILIDQGSLRDTAMDAIVSAHIRALQPGHLIDIPTSSQHVVKPWFDGKVDFVPPVKDLADQGFDLVGGRLDYVAGRNAAVLVYRSRLHMIDLFATRTGVAGSGSNAMSAPNGYNVVHWTQGEEEFWVVSDLNKDELAAFARPCGRGALGLQQTGIDRQARRTRFPVAEKIALQIAGAITGTQGSPAPDGGAVLGTI